MRRFGDDRLAPREGGKEEGVVGQIEISGLPGRRYNKKKRKPKCTKKGNRSIPGSFENGAFCWCWLTEGCKLPFVGNIPTKCKVKQNSHPYNGS